MHERKRPPATNADMTSANKVLMKTKKIKVSVIFNLNTHRMIKAITATEGGKISDLMEKLAHEYLKERGKV
jgi:hypothetical protein